MRTLRFNSYSLSSTRRLCWLRRCVASRRIVSVTKRIVMCVTKQLKFTFNSFVLGPPATAATQIRAQTPSPRKIFHNSRAFIVDKSLPKCYNNTRKRGGHQQPPQIKKLLKKLLTNTNNVL